MIIRGRFLLLIQIAFLTFSCNNPQDEFLLNASQITDTIPEKELSEPVLMYGIPSDSFDQISGHIKRNAFLSEILLKHGITIQEIDKLLKNSVGVFDVRTIKAGNNYILFCDKDSLARARYMVYEHDPATCYIFSLTDSLNISLYKKEMRSEIKYASGVIETSLWDAMISQGLHPSLTIKLSEIFAWTVDFFGLQKGDSFKVIYEELYIGDKLLGTGALYGAVFNWSGTAITAIPFIQDSTESYFDLDGNSLRKAFLKAPLQFSRISSRYSTSRMHPILRIRRPHLGVDYAAPSGTPVHAIGDGKVIYAKTETESGRIVRIQHNSVYSTAYMHLSRFGPGIKSGVYVKQNDIIGYVGTSGLATGPHLDFRFYKNGSPVDPLKVEAPPVEPVLEANRERFEKLKTVVLSLLNTFN